MKTRVIIIDDESLARERIKNFLSHLEEEISIVAEADNGLSGLDAIREYNPDLIFLDIQMPEMDGFTMLEQLAPDERPRVIFTTAFDEYAIKAFEVHALDYLLKPFSKERFLSSIDHVLEYDSSSVQIQQKLETLLSSMNRPAISRLSIKDQGRVYFIQLDEVQWIESAGNYVVIHLEESNHIMRETMTHLERQLPEGDFIRISRSAIVRLDVITELGTNAKGEHQIVLSSGVKLKTTHSLKELQAKLETC